jgi:hypothetical protein
VNRNGMQLALREMRRQFADLRLLLVLGVIGIVLGAAGPFGTFEELSLAPRLVYWLTVVVLTYGSGVGLALAVNASLPERTPLWQRFIAMVAVAGFGATLIVALVEFVVHGAERFQSFDVLVLVAQCYVVTAGVVAALLVFEIPRPAAPTSPPATIGILDRVPLPQRGRLLALSVDDHYVDVVTDKGTTLVLMRLADAIREAKGLPGLQIHRSHWVTLDAVRRVHRSGGKTEIELSNGQRLPVSRGYSAAVKAAGLG